MSSLVDNNVRLARPIGANKLYEIKPRLGDSRCRDPTTLTKDIAPLANVQALFSGSSSTAEAVLDNYLQQVTARFLNDERVHNEVPDAERLAESFSDFEVSAKPQPSGEYFRRLVQDVVSSTTRVSSPLMIGHMTTSLPYFQRPLAKLIAALNQNTVKVETSSTVTFLERETVAKLHNAFYQKETSFYDDTVHRPESCLGTITSGGTLANLTALWCARNAALGPQPGFDGIEKEGLLRAMRFYGYTDAVIIGSKLMHYSMNKAADLLGLGVQTVVRIPTDEKYCMRIDLLEQELERCQRERVLVLTVVGIAGATETGSVDNLEAIANLCERFGGIHFHVDAAWGGPLIFSARHSPKLKGIERAGSITVDGHKQLYTPMGCGVVLFRDPYLTQAIRKTANYIIRQESFDAGKFSAEGSRPANVIYLHATLSLLGTSGLEALIDQTSDLVAQLALQLEQLAEYEIIAAPSTNILLYRWIPLAFRQKLASKTLSLADNEHISRYNRELQSEQARSGDAFISRTTVFSPRYQCDVAVMRVVIANPLTTPEHVTRAIQEQLRIAHRLDDSSVVVA